MKAIILAAGKGERLRPLTNNTPKCLIPINGKPILKYWLDACGRAGFSEVLVNGHYLAEKVEEYLVAKKEAYSFSIQYVYESELLGTGGTVRNNRSFFEKEDFFFFCHGDNFSNIDIAEFIKFHKKKKGSISVALFKTDTPSQCGIAEEIDSDDRIIRFVEKPLNPISNLASAAIFLMSSEVLADFPVSEEVDFSKDVLPKYQGRMYGYRIKGFNIDIGTPANLAKADERAKQLGMGIA